MMKKTLVLLITIMAVIGLSGIATAQMPRNMHKDKCNNIPVSQVQVSKNVKEKCFDNEKEDGNCNNIPGVMGNFVPSGDRPGGENGKCDDHKDKDKNNCNMPGSAPIRQEGEKGNVLKIFRGGWNSVLTSVLSLRFTSF